MEMTIRAIYVGEREPRDRPDCRGCRPNLHMIAVARRSDREERSIATGRKEIRVGHLGNLA